MSLVWYVPGAFVRVLHINAREGCSANEEAARATLLCLDGVDGAKKVYFWAIAAVTQSPRCASCSPFPLDRVDYFRLFVDMGSSLLPPPGAFSSHWQWRSL